MSTSNTTLERSKSTIEVMDEIENYLLKNVTDDHGYFKSKEIANNIDAGTKQVAAVITEVDERSEDLSIKKWGYSKCTTWLVEICSNNPYD